MPSQLTKIIYSELSPFTSSQEIAIESRQPGGYQLVRWIGTDSVDWPCAATSWKVDVLEKIAGNYASTSPGFISQIVSVLEIAFTMLTLERERMHGTFVSFLQLT